MNFSIEGGTYDLKFAPTSSHILAALSVRDIQILE